MIEHTAPQGTPEWLAARRGVITGSRAKDARDFLKNGAPGAKRLGYAMDTARERCGGTPESVYVNAAMRTGTEQEPFAAIAYMAQTGRVVEEVGFCTTDDRKFGMSLDRRVVGENGALEIKTMVSSATLFKAMVDGDISEYRDQCDFGLWLFTLDWIDLCLWAPDLEHLHVIRILRDENRIQALEDELLAFDKLVGEYEAKLRRTLGAKGVEPPAPKPTPTAIRAPQALVADPF